jgi:hypothetical protein
MQNSSYLTICRIWEFIFFYNTLGPIIFLIHVVFTSCNSLVILSKGAFATFF